MRYLLTNGQMREADRHETVFTAALVLMERAGKAVAERIEKLAIKGKIACVCGGGNNGGDGFVCARYLLQKKYDVCVVCNADKFSDETQENKDEFLALGGKIVEEIPTNTALIVDCLLGTGFKGELRSESVEIIRKINEYGQSGAYVLAVDIPSGLCGDNGQGKIAVKANQTLCIGEEKIGVRLSDGLDCSGEIRTLDIGIKARERYTGEFVRLLQKEDVKAILPTRKRNTHKGSYGSAAIVAGSEEYGGAALLSVRAAIKSGVGYATLFTPQGIKNEYFLRAPEALLVGVNGGGMVEFNEKDFEKLCGYDAVAYGMGLTITKDVYLGVKYLLERYDGKLILDADALNSLAAYGNVGVFLRKRKCDVLITPHVKEFSRLTGLSVAEILHSPVDCVRRISRAYGITVLLKNASTLISSDGMTYLNVTGNSAQAKGGSGDVLSGLICGLCAQGLSVFDGAKVGSFLLGRAAEIAAEEQSEYAATPSDFIEKFGEAYLSVAENSDENGEG